jgi:putative addiction module killer protein
MRLDRQFVSYKGQCFVLEVRQTEAFAAWRRDLRDAQARSRILVRIDRLVRGNPGDVRPVSGDIQVRWAAHARWRRDDG